MMLGKRIFLNDVLFVLNAGDSLGWPDLTRTNFQKILYLSAVLAPLEQRHWEYEFTNAPYGPFNSEIHQASDLLVVPYGYATTTELIVQKDSKMRARYKITPKGAAEVQAISRLQKERQRLEWIRTVMKVLDIYGPTVVTKLAYEEPTFSRMRKDNKGGKIDLSPDENQSIKLISRVTKELEKKYQINLDTTLSKLITYFDFLSKGISYGTEKWAQPSHQKSNG
jgi:hypothetical protein